MSPGAAASALVDDFRGPTLRGDLWIPHYLPQWTTPGRSAARFQLGPDGLELRIERDQPGWRPEDAPLRVSNLQTGAFSGPVGSARGTHRHREDGLRVRTDVGTRLLWAPSSGRLSVRVTASDGAGCMLAAWLVGTEHRSERESGEICVFEIDAAAVAADRTTARCGIKARHDPRLRDDMAEVVLPFPALRPHTWTVEWVSGRTTIACEGVVVRRLDQAPGYPMLLMLDLFEIGQRRGPYPETAVVHRVEGLATDDDSEPVDR